MGRFYLHEKMGGFIKIDPVALLWLCDVRRSVAFLQQPIFEFPTRIQRCAVEAPHKVDPFLYLL